LIDQCVQRFFAAFAQILIYLGCFFLQCADTPGATVIVTVGECNHQLILGDGRVDWDRGGASASS
jgi:hypothetical protein